MSAPAPFQLSFSPNLPELLLQLNCSIILSTYQANKVMIISPQNKERLMQLPRNFQKAMALGVSGDKLAIAEKDRVVILANDKKLAGAYPKQPGVYDSIFLPRAVLHTGELDLHALEWGKEGLWAVNTVFSSLCILSDQYNFIPWWQPPFISALAPEDRCHLNGLAMKEGQPEYVTAFSTGDTRQSWRENIPGSGVVIHVPSNEIIARDLAMPHSPRFYDNRLYLLLSAKGELAAVDPAAGKCETISRFNGFVRGMNRIGDHLFIAVSRLRKNASAFKDLPIAGQGQYSGIKVIHLPTAALVAELFYQSSVDEIFDVQLLPGMLRPGILNTSNDVRKLAYSIPENSFWVNAAAHN